MTVPKTPVTTPAAKVVSQQTVFDGFHKLQVIELQPRSMRDGGWADKMEREMFTAGPYSTVILYKPETDEILLNEQFRIGAFMAGADDPFLFECPAGMIDDGETPEQAAIRETLEETGCEIKELELVGSYYTSPGCLDEEAFVFLGRIDSVQTGEIFGVEEEGEEIRTHLLPAQKVFEMLDNGFIQNCSSALALNWFARHKDGIRKRWLGEAA
jgi:ADP-ribose pyrophosphatase